MMCSNQALWDSRGEFPNFECSLEYLSNQRSLRVCTATLAEVDDDLNIKRTQLNTTCLTTCYENCYYDGERIY